MYAHKNSITIALIWVSVMVVGIYWYQQETKKLSSLKIENNTLKNQLDGSNEIINTLNEAKSMFSQLEWRSKQARKIMLTVEEPTFSLQYLNWLISKYNLTLDFDFELKDVKVIKNITTFDFILKGEGSYNNIYKLVLYLTKNPLLYQIESFQVTKKDNADLLNFNMNIKGFSLAKKDETNNDFNFASMQYVSDTGHFYNAFKTVRIKRIIPIRKKISKPKIDKNLLNIENTSLLAVASGVVYLKSKEKKIHTLKIGDKVVNGVLTKINRKKSEVEFQLNKDGMKQTVILGLGYIK